MTPDRRAARARTAHLALLLVGLVVLAYGLTLGGATVPRCRGAEMTPGSVCVKADGSAGQSYEQRLATRRSARPVVAGVGLAVTAFAVVLLVTDARRRPGARGGPLDSPVEDAG